MLIKSAELKIVLIVMKAKSRWDDHKTAARISVHALRGHIRFYAPGRFYDLHPGELLELNPNVLHSVESMEESAFLLTLGATT
jgi:quercetin dioxygenase-like cupin family protein